VCAVRDVVVGFVFIHEMLQINLRTCAILTITNIISFFCREPVVTSKVFFDIEIEGTKDGGRVVLGLFGDDGVCITERLRKTLMLPL
jgi:hypothetical protein